MSYQYIKPKNREELLRVMETSSQYHLLAGGTDLMVRVRLGRIVSGTFIDISEMEDLQKIEISQDVFTVGAAVHHAAIARSAMIIKRAPALAMASAAVGSPQIRNRGTLGGNAGNASPAGDTIPPLLAYGAVLNIVGIEGRRKIPLKDFFIGPGRTVLKKNEYIESFSFRGHKKGEGSAFEKLGKRKALAISIVNAGTFLSINENGIIMEARIALGSVAATPIRVLAAEEILRGQKITKELLVSAAQKVEALVSPIDDVRSEALYRKKMAGVLTRRALEKSWEASLA